MLTRANRGDAAESERRLRICAVCDGMDAVLRLAGYVAQFSGTVSRTDLSLGEALDFLKTYDGDDFDQVVISPDADKEAAPRLVNAILDAAAARSSVLVIVLPPKTRFQIESRPGLHVLYGPPFEAYDAVSGATVPDVAQPGKVSRRGGLRSLWTKRKQPGPQDGAPNAAPPSNADIPVAARSVIAVQPLSGGSGATMIACNMAAEFAQAKPAISTCLVDLNLQFGNVGTYFNLPADSRILDAYRNIRAMDSDAFQTCLRKVDDKLHVFTCPGEILPFDALTSADLYRIVDLAREVADLVILDLPHTIADWSEGAFSKADLVLGVCTLDVRSAQNAVKLRDLIRSEAMAPTKLAFVQNYAHRRRNRLWREALVEMERGLGGQIEQVIPDGGEEVTLACNAGMPLWRYAAGNPARIAIRDFVHVLSPTIATRRLTEMAD